ncbi:FtsX-like permease family protein [Solibacillus sp. FSL W8-0474]|uniref:FtsX-like permease family protein n=1 Tax=Solibacillus sp. FSL W8-0474 TaxID=2975336 RepID=UPI0030F6F74D
MNLAWKEIKKNKSKFFIFGLIVLLISLLTFMIAGLANGLSQDNAALIKELPDGQFYMTTEAEDNYALSRISSTQQKELLKKYPNATALSIQMGMFHNAEGNQQSVAFVTTTESDIFPKVAAGEMIVDSSLKEEGFKIGDILTSNQFSGQWEIVGFSEQTKFNHAAVAFIHQEDFTEMYRTTDLQLLFLANEEVETMDGLTMYSNKDFLNTIPSYSAEQLSLNMIIWFLVVISGMLFAIFFYMMNVQKIGLFGILKAIGVKTSTLFIMMWTQMLLISAIALSISLLLSQLFQNFAPQGMPFHLTLNTTLLFAAIFLIIGFFGATLSGLQIKKVQPLQAIQQGEI